MLDADLNKDRRGIIEGLQGSGKYRLEGKIDQWELYGRTW
jgi:hypothetical protein